MVPLSKPRSNQTVREATVRIDKTMREAAGAKAGDA